MPSETTGSSLSESVVGLGIALAAVLFVGFVYSVLVLERVLLFVWGAMALGSVLLVGFLVWLFYRLVVAVEDLAATSRRIESSLEDR